MKEYIDKQAYIGQFLRFGIVGIIATAVLYGVYCLLLLVLIHNLAYTIGYIVSFLINYLLTTKFTFNSNRTFYNGIGFTICHVINYMMNIGLLNLFIYIGLSEIVAPIPVLGICVPSNFLMVRMVMLKLSRK